MNIVKFSKKNGFVSRETLINVADEYYPIYLTEMKNWLQSKYKILVEVNFNDGLYRKLHEKAHKKKSSNYHWCVFTNIDDPDFFYEKFWSDDTFESYEKSLEKALEYGLKLIR